MDNLIGQVIRTYRIDSRIDAGGFGIVYRAFQPIIEREVALKVILPRYANEVDFIHRFEIEAQTVARLEHPYIVPLYDYWRDPNGAYLVMRLMRGGSLRDVISEGGQPLDTVVTYLNQISSALSIAHRQKIVHRDIKPQNILLDEEGNAYLSDFGIAKDLDLQEELEAFAGSVNYLAPEIIRAKGATVQSDIYSLALMTYEMLTGHLPFGDRGASETLMKHLNDPLPDVQIHAPHLPQSVNTVLARAAAKDIEDRYQSVTDFARAMREITGDMSIVTRTSTIEMFALVDNPYKGLRAFDESDAGDFFGREQLTNTIVDRLNEDAYAANFLAVVGPSGSGKSSVIRAGLFPRLRDGDVADTFNWFVADFTPSNTPTGNLANALLQIAPAELTNIRSRMRNDEHALVWATETILEQSDDARLFLYIDQFEEIFTLEENADVRDHFLKLISNAIEHSPDIYIIVTIRADFFDKPLMYEGIGDLIQSRTQVVLPLTTHEIEQAIVRPAERLGLDVERQLVAAIIADVREEPGALPLLQYALTELFDRRTANQMTYQSYEDMGGVLSVLAKRAQEIFESLSTVQKQIARQIFLRMVTLGEGTEDTRRRVRRAELLGLDENRAEVEAVIEAFGKYRLLTFDSDPTTREPTVEIAHEALIKRWQQLQTWLDDNRADVRLQRSLALAANDWENNNREQGFLLFGGRLVQYEDWLNQTSISLTELETIYLNASLHEKVRREERAREEEAQKQKLQAQLLTRTQIIAGLSLVAAILTAGLMVFAFNQSRVAQDERDNAQIAQLTSDANAIAAQERAEEIQSFNLINVAQQAILTGDSGLSNALLLTLNQRSDLSPNVEREAYNVAYSTLLRDRLAGHTRQISTIAINPDETILATGSEDLTIILWDLATDEQLRQLTGHQGSISGVMFSPDGSQLISSANDARLILWDVNSGSIVREFRGHRNVITDVAFAPEGDRIVSSSSDDTVIIWDVATGDIIHQLEGHTDSVRAVDFSPDGNSILSASRDQSIILWDAMSGRSIRRFSEHTDSVQTVAFTPNGDRFISGSFDSTAIVWDIATGNTISRFIGHSDEVTSIAIDTNEETVISTSCAERDASRTCIAGEVILWDLASGRELQSYSGHAELVTDSLFINNNAQIITSSCATRREGTCLGGEALTWDTFPSNDVIAQYLEHESSVFSVVVNTDGTRLLSGGGSVLQGDQPQGDTSIILWDTADQRVIRQYFGHTGSVSEVMFHPNGTDFLSASRDGTIRVWSLDAGSQSRQFDGHSGTIYDIDLTADGREVISTDDEQVLIWDYETGDIRLTIADLGIEISALSVALNPAQTILVTGLNNGVIVLWDMSTGEEIRRLTGHTDDVLSLDFSADGSQLLSGSADRTMRIWNVNTGSEIQVYRGHLEGITDVRFSPVSDHLLSASFDDTLRYWDISSGDTIRIFTGHTDNVLDASLTSNGAFAYTASADGSVRAWRISLDAVLNWVAENRYIRPITTTEADDLRLDLAGE